MRDREIHTVAVIGAGIMGIGIAQSIAEAGISVRMIDLNQQVLEQSLERIDSNLHLFEEFSLLSETPAMILSRIEIISTDKRSEGTMGCDFIVESVPEVIDTKRRVFARWINCLQR